MNLHEPNRFYSSLLDETFKNERDLIKAIKIQIKKEELKFKDFINNDEAFSEAKTVRERINYMKQLLASEQAKIRSSNN